MIKIKEEILVENYDFLAKFTEFSVVSLEVRKKLLEDMLLQENCLHLDNKDIAKLFNAIQKFYKEKGEIK